MAFEGAEDCEFFIYSFGLEKQSSKGQFIFRTYTFFFGIFQGFCLKVSEDFFYRTSPCIFVVIVNRLCIIFLKSRNHDISNVG